ncbi:smad nuclear-interacting protein 1 [Cryptococcus deuterogattii 99/473]|uniref:Smad nuclear-interacting protein 1 n=1 Tax=Cryptococcus deuterogattii Ram5 TaxID=1296110 RepID=A0A0D0U0C3_9TREE|nr:smad nuclear-interacting protein 1 [Cryptococcus deuterogattii LA55]KIR33992.1 smad nuclear-interacting protein 1 [Cryptococcus deuterogattii MMRL2647]KIR41623.1 smad nuclear-interacting protein 1 [Cryptococcus deuterogattii Ram5]KIR71865.1 smad nuclear-interacting protein 1 [Cryptococcus deuterogattii CA1014]KIR91447.1 smad nuclear-interacting protein 1 [Cryptococcus deuterogattii CBS 10090]KIR98364.1 smad nuclear-interacting protein 1 [Cryptococcus deuterogattii 2001/935-1]KIY54713.1 sma
MPGPSDSRRRDDSRSPRRDRDSSSYHRRRSPNRPNSGRPSKPQDIGWGDSNKVGEREKDARYDRGSDRDDRGSYRSSSRRDREGSYGEKERVSERAKDRKRYDDDVKKEGPDQPLVEPEKPNFSNSGLLAKETNTVKGVVVKYNEPAEARKPTKNWRLYVFKGTEQIGKYLIHIYRQSCYLIGRDEVVRSSYGYYLSYVPDGMTERNEYGDVATTIKPFIIDLESTNGTFVNDIEVPKSRYYELRASDVWYILA